MVTDAPGAGREKRGIGALPQALLYLALAAAFTLLFSCYTSPVMREHFGGDSAFFTLMGKAMTCGRVPYRDCFDMKGPYLFLIEYAGQALCYGRAGIFALETLSLWLTLLFAGAIYRLCGVQKRGRRLLLLPALFLIAATIQGGNLTEEYSLFPLCACLYLCLKYFAARAQAASCPPHPPLYAAAYGAAFGFLALVRINNAALLCAIVLSVLVCLMRAKLFKNLALNAAGFIAGAAVACAPALIYCKAHGILEEMLDQVFVFGFAYSAEVRFAQRLSGYASRLPLLAALFLPLMSLALRRSRDPGAWTLAVSGALATVVALGSGRAYIHYYMLAAPLFLWGLGMLFGGPGKAEKSISPRAARRTAALLLVLISPFFLLACGRSALCALPQKTVEDKLIPALPAPVASALSEHDFYPEEDIRDIASHIPAEDKDSVFGYGFDAWVYAYMDGVFPCNRYFSWQRHYIRLRPQIEGEIASFMLGTPPRWMLLPAADKPIPPLIRRRLDEDYTLVFQNGSYRLFQCSQDQKSEGIPPLPID